MTEQPAQPAVRELMVAATSLDQQLAAMPEDDLLAHMQEVATGLQAGGVRVLGRLATAMPPGSPVGEYAVSLLNVLGGLTGVVMARRAQIAAETAAAAESAAAIAAAALAEAAPPEAKRARRQPPAAA